MKRTHKQLVEAIEVATVEILQKAQLKKYTSGYDFKVYTPAFLQDLPITKEVAAKYQIPLFMIQNIFNR